MNKKRYSSFYFPILLGLLLCYSLSSAAAFKSDYDSALKAYESAGAKTEFKRIAGLFHDLSKRDDAGRLRANTHYWEGECWFRAEDYERAIQAFERVQLHPDSYKEEPARFMVAKCLIFLNKEKQAKWEVERFLKDYPKSKFNKYLKSRIREMGGQSD